MPRQLDPAPILAALDRHGVRYVLVGGLASEIHGVPLPTTEDLDITPATERENLDRLSDVLRELDARIRAPDAPKGLPFSHDGASLAAARVWNLVTRHGPMDLAMVPDGTEGYDDLARSMHEVTAFGIRVPVAALKDIIRSKEAAGRPKDLLHLPILYKSLHRKG